MVTAAAKSVPGLDVQTLLNTRNSASVADTAKRYDAQAEADQVGGTPALYIGKSGGKLVAFSPATPRTRPRFRRRSTAPCAEPRLTADFALSPGVSAISRASRPARAR